MNKKLLIGIIAILVAGCAAPQSALPQAASAAAAVVPTTTVTRVQVVQPTPTTEAQATATALPTVAPSATATPSPSPTATPTNVSSQTASVTASGVSSAASSAASSTASSAASGVLLAINPQKYPTPSLLTPDNDTTYHVSQPVVHFAWSATRTELLKFGQTPGCVSDATNFRRAYEAYQLIIHSLDVSQPDIVQWTDNNPSFDLNLTTVPAGRYSWSVNVATLCESYVVGQRNDLSQKHQSTLQTTYVGAVSPTSMTRIINWVP